MYSPEVTNSTGSRTHTMIQNYRKSQRAQIATGLRPGPTYCRSCSDGSTSPAFLFLPSPATAVVHASLLKIAVLAFGVRASGVVANQTLHHLARSVLSLASHGRVLHMTGCLDKCSNLERVS